MEEEDQSNQGSQAITIKLTPREYEVLQLIGRGLSNSEIAQKLYVEPGTIKTHIRKIYVKCDLNRDSDIAIKRVKLSLFAIGAGITSSTPSPYQFVISKRYESSKHE